MAGATTLAALVLGVCVCVASGKPVSIGDARVRESDENSNAGDLLTNNKQIMSNWRNFSETIRIGEDQNTPYQNDAIDEKAREQSKNEISTSIINSDNDGGSQNNHDDRIKRSRRSYHDVHRREGRNYGRLGHRERSGRYTRRDDYYEDRYNERGRRDGGRGRSGRRYEDYSGEGGGRGRGGSNYEDHSGEGGGRGRGGRRYEDHGSEGGGRGRGGSTYEDHRGEGISTGGGGKGLLAGGGGFGIDLGAFKVTAGGGGSPYGEGNGHADRYSNH